MNFERLSKSYFGKEYEYDLVGRVNINNPKYWEELKCLQEKAKSQGYKPFQKDSLPFKDAIEFTKNFQLDDPTNPTRDFARELRLAFAEKLGLEKDEDLEKLKLYSCVDGPLDAHGIDFFISYLASPKQKKEFIITFDITKNPKKDSGNADLIVTNIPDPEDSDFNEDEYLNKIDVFAKKGIEILQQKMH